MENVAALVRRAIDADPENQEAAETLETLCLQLPSPQREQESGRPFRRSPLYDRLKSRGAWFGNKMGWERPNWFAGSGQVPDMQYGWGRGAWFDAVASEHRATREGVTVVGVAVPEIADVDRRADHLVDLDRERR